MHVLFLQLLVSDVRMCLIVVAEQSSRKYGFWVQATLAKYTWLNIGWMV